MTSAEFKAAFRLADSEADLSGFSLDRFDGFGLPDFKPVTVCLGDVASLIRYQGKYILADGWDMEAVEAVKFYGRRRFLIAG